ncbi:MAG: metal-dependent hydrolase [Sphingobium sp.]
MDNFTHSLTGWALGQTGLKTKTRKGLAALVLGANLPDIDVFFGWVPWAPLATHRGFTHGLVGGVLILPAILAGLLWLLDRWQRSRGKVFRSGLAMDARWLVGLAYLGALTHPLLDLQTTYAVQLLSPFSTRWFHTETLFIVDAVICTVLPLAIGWSRRLEGRGRPWRRQAVVGLTMVAAYLALNGAISLAALQARATQIGGRPDIVYANQEPVLFWKRTLVWREHGRIGQASYDPSIAITGVSDIQPMVDDGMGDPLVARAMRTTPDLLPFLRWSTMPVASTRIERCVARIGFGDARYMARLNGALSFEGRRPFAGAEAIVPLNHCDPAAAGPTGTGE